MAGDPYYAVVYAYGADGEEEAYMPCFSHEQVMARAARYEKVRVVGDGFPPFWLRLTEEEKAKHILPTRDDFEPEFNLNRPQIDPVVSSKQSSTFYDSWRGYKKSSS